MTNKHRHGSLESYFFKEIWNVDDLEHACYNSTAYNNFKDSKSKFSWEVSSLAKEESVKYLGKIEEVGRKRREVAMNKKIFVFLWLTTLVVAGIGLLFIIVLIGGAILMHLQGTDNTDFYFKYFRSGGPLQVYGMVFLFGGLISFNIFHKLSDKLGKD